MRLRTWRLRAVTWILTLPLVGPVFARRIARRMFRAAAHDPELAPMSSPPAWRKT
jgi:hypothetical protein